MSFVDIIGLIIFVFFFITFSIVALFMWDNLNISGVPNNFNTTMNASINKSVSFWDSGMAAIFLIISIASVILTVFLNSHPVLLAIWVLINLVTLIVWDTFNDTLTIFINSPVNGGHLDNAASFFQSDMPKFIPIINMFIGIFLFSKKVRE